MVEKKDEKSGVEQRRVKIGEGVKLSGQSKEQEGGKEQAHDVSDHNKYAQQDANHLGHNVTAHTSDPAKDSPSSLAEEAKKAGEAFDKAQRQALAESEKEKAKKLAKE